ncbi:MAG: 30S ribosomal protein S17 [Elusimicrobia bacterium]|nr:30S ribosomal protein S17 [Elusimicrobiota bacterium]
MRKRLIGRVLQDKNPKTRIVEIMRFIMHPRYKKFLRRRRKFHCHDEKNISKAGDRVVIEEARPFSKLKRWKVVKVLNEGSEQ